MDIIVSDMYKIKFSIGKHYSCEVLCDVLDMDVCHVILGRPWQFDAGAIYDGRANIYSLDWKGRKLRLLSQPVGHTPKANDAKAAIHIVTGGALLSTWRETSLLFALYVKELALPNCDSKPESKVTQLMSQFHDVLPVTLPKTLPPLRTLQHQFVLISGATLPNLPHYRMSPKEHQVLQQLVEELLENKLIQPSLSPCVVPALLPKKDGS
ncbi:uncharacterized protein LOC110092903 [Dendrobium catenatum]|uniref:uncharacterized protein LOC110092903 n=1 Tax=Dendrobium catenatum TaxID=906689 RepID=UPI0009F5DA6E|nr:uncharacterized protein LOC110092903 [Dendrobium catenatum]